MTTPDRSKNPRTPDVLILGAGPAGQLCALTAARRGLSVTLVHQGGSPAPKLRASGGGRCNCTNTAAAPAHYLSANPRFTAQALKRFGPDAFLALLAGLGLSAHEEDHGRLFCDQGAAALADRLEAACRAEGCRFLPERVVLAVLPPPAEKEPTRDRPAGLFRVEAHLDGRPDQTEALFAPRVVLALGSPAWPALGGTDITARLAGMLGLAHLPARPALTPLLLSGPEGALCRELSGIGLTARVSACGKSYTDGLLFTHQGLSGPAALQISSHWRKGEALSIDLAPETDVPALLRAPENARALARGVVARLLPRRLAEARLAALSPHLGGRRLAELSRAELGLLAQAIADWRVTPTGTAGMARAEAASGGLDTAGFSAKTMRSRAIPGLFAVGEALDIAGELGGFNLQWAWASGHAAGSAL